MIKENERGKLTYSTLAVAQIYSLHIHTYRFVEAKRAKKTDFFGFQQNAHLPPWNFQIILLHAQWMETFNNSGNAKCCLPPSCFSQLYSKRKPKIGGIRLTTLRKQNETIRIKNVTRDYTIDMTKYQQSLSFPLKTSSWSYVFTKYSTIQMKLFVAGLKISKWKCSKTTIS